MGEQREITELLLFQIIGAIRDVEQYLDAVDFPGAVLSICYLVTHLILTTIDRPGTWHRKFKSLAKGHLYSQ